MYSPDSVFFLGPGNILISRKVSTYEYEESKICKELSELMSIEKPLVPKKFNLWTFLQDTKG
jgi:hypothetical protein